MNGNQIRSTSPFDMPLRSASTTAASAAPTRSQSARSRSLPKATAVAAPRASANAARSMTTNARYGRDAAIPASYRARVAARPANHQKPAAANAPMTSTLPASATRSRPDPPARDRHGDGNEGHEDEPVRTECRDGQEHAAGGRREVAAPVATPGGDDHERGAPCRHSHVERVGAGGRARSRWARSRGTEPLDARAARRRRLGLRGAPPVPRARRRSRTHRRPNPRRRDPTLRSTASKTTVPGGCPWT